jgi:hypothetical protein
MLKVIVVGNDYGYHFDSRFFIQGENPRKHFTKSELPSTLCHAILVIPTGRLILPRCLGIFTCSAGTSVDQCGWKVFLEFVVKVELAGLTRN